MKILLIALVLALFGCAGDGSYQDRGGSNNDSPFFCVPGFPPSENC